MLKIVKSEIFPLQTLDKRMLVIVVLHQPKFRNRGKQHFKFI